MLDIIHGVSLNDEGFRLHMHVTESIKQYGSVFSIGSLIILEVDIPLVMITFMVN